MKRRVPEAGINVAGWPQLTVGLGLPPPLGCKTLEFAPGNQQFPPRVRGTLRRKRSRDPRCCRPHTPRRPSEGGRATTERHRNPFSRPETLKPVFPPVCLESAPSPAPPPPPSGPTLRPRATLSGGGGGTGIGFNSVAWVEKYRNYGDTSSSTRFKARKPDINICSWYLFLIVLWFH